MSGKVAAHPLRHLFYRTESSDISVGYPNLSAPRNDWAMGEFLRIGQIPAVYHANFWFGFFDKN
jgi:hypothetical protein